MLQKISLLCLGLFSFIQAVSANTLQEKITPIDNGVLSGLPNTNADNKQYQLDSILGYIRDSIFGLMAMIAIGVFLYIGFKLISARGNPEEFKKALNTLIYAVIGIFIVSFAWAAVKLVAGLNI